MFCHTGIAKCLHQMYVLGRVVLVEHFQYSTIQLTCISDLQTANITVRRYAQVGAYLACKPYEHLKTLCTLFTVQIGMVISPNSTYSKGQPITVHR